MTPTSTATPDAAAGSAVTETAAAVVESAATAAPATEVATSGEATGGLGLESRGAEAARANSPTNTLNLLLPLAGVALIAGGILLALMTRIRGPKTPDEPKPDQPK
jgi:hypothetical protein